ncbi:AMP-binding protein [Pseudonocardia spinosispora]|uniref:AMP-binding protein n=1 Tax=Pseudonocardia spinosispora TaxID=103441 RepID=UPI000403C643|nr:AMP-binding protein [Pseudonocardia spinosispora]
MASEIIRPEDRYSAETIAGFRSEGFWRDGALAERVEHWAGVQGDKVAVSDGYGELTWSQLHAQSLRLALRLRELGVEHGDRVQVQLPSWNEYVVVYAALGRLGAVLVPTMPIYRWDEVTHAINHAGAVVSVVCGTYRKFDYHQMIRDVRPNCPTLRHVITVRTEAGDGESRYEDLVAGDDVPSADELGPLPSADDPHAIIFTSGTESRPKGCYHTFNTFGYTVHALGEDVLGVGPDDTLFMPSPITHATGLAVGVTIPLVLGASTHVMDSWEANAGLERIREHGCTVSMGATPFVQMALDAYDPEKHDLTSMRVWASAGAPIPPGLLADWKAKFPDCALLPIYGRSEGLLVTSCRQGDDPDKVLSSDGRALPGVDLRIQAEDGTQVAAGEEGEICHGGPGLMLGYWRDPERTAEAIEPNGVSHSGDLGRVDDEGYMRVTGRIKDLIIRGGTNISAREVEDHLVTHPKVAAAAVVAMPDRVLGERACAFVVPAGEAPTFEELTDYLRNERQIAVVKLPERLELIDELPMTATGKIQKFVLREKLTNPT